MLPFNIRLVIVYSTLSYNLVLTQPCRRAGKNCIMRTGAPVSDANNANGGEGQGKPGKLDPSGQPSVDDGKPKKRCCPYDFDSSRCKIVDDRVLCGFNRNGAWPQSRDIVKELSDGCRLRDGRLECGYVEEPYHNLRRPPAWDTEPGNNELPADNGDNGEGVIVQSPDSIERLKGGKKGTKQKRVDSKPKPNCVEVEGRIVCKPRT